MCRGCEGREVEFRDDPAALKKSGWQIQIKWFQMRCKAVELNVCSCALRFFLGYNSMMHFACLASWGGNL